MIWLHRFSFSFFWYQNGLEEIKKIAKFLGVPENDDLFRAIHEKCHFDKLSVDKQYSPEIAEQEFHQGFTMFRKGKLPCLHALPLASVPHLIPENYLTRGRVMKKKKQQKQCGFRTGQTKTELVQAQKMARDGTFWIWIIEKLYCPCSENKDVDQLRSHCEADLRHCFRMLAFS